MVLCSSKRSRSTWGWECGLSREFPPGRRAGWELILFKYVFFHSPVVRCSVHHCIWLDGNMHMVQKLAYYPIWYLILPLWVFKFLNTHVWNWHVSVLSGILSRDVSDIINLFYFRLACARMVMCLRKPVTLLILADAIGEYRILVPLGQHWLPLPVRQQRISLKMEQQRIPQLWIRWRLQVRTFTQLNFVILIHLRIKRYNFFTVFLSWIHRIRKVLGLQDPAL